MENGKGDLISREAAKEAVKYIPWCDWSAVGRTLDELPSIDAVPVVHGRWIYDVNAQDWGIGGFRCSECDALNYNLPTSDKIHTSWFVGSKYCPDCGAMMDKED